MPLSVGGEVRFDLMSGSPSISLASEGPKGGGKENERG